MGLDGYIRKQAYGKTYISKAREIIESMFISFSYGQKLHANGHTIMGLHSQNNPSEDAFGRMPNI